MRSRFLLFSIALLPLIGISPIVFSEAGSDQRQKEDELVISAYKEAAEKGNSFAQYQLGVHHYSGEFGTQNKRLAEKWLKRAAKQDHAQAQYLLGTMYLIGDGVLQDFEAAMKWLVPSARHGVANSQFSIGVIYLDGLGVKKDNIKAYKWFNIAASNGHHRAPSLRNDLIHKLTSEEISQAQAESKQWIEEKCLMCTIKSMQQ